MKLKKLDLNKSENLFAECFLNDFAGKLEEAGYLGKSHLWNPITDKIERMLLKQLGPKIVVPSHCTSWRGIYAILEAIPRAFVWNSVGNLYRF